MFSWDNLDDRVSIVQMNSELRHAQLEMLSAHCATHQLRLRFSIDDLARFGQRDVLRKSLQAANALSEYYTSIKDKIPSAETDSEPVAELTDERVQEAVARVSSYLRDQHERYFGSAEPLSKHQKALMWPYFSAALLDQVRVLKLNGVRVPNPPFYAEARSLGFYESARDHAHALPDFSRRHCFQRENHRAVSVSRTRACRPVRSPGTRPLYRAFRSRLCKYQASFLRAAREPCFYA